jgi:formylglycine-generating enzyme
MQYNYEVAISFAVENKDTAMELTACLYRNGYTKVYDYRHHQERMVGRNLEKELRSIYESEARFVIILFSKYYFSKWAAGIEYEAIKRRMQKEEDNLYMIPVWLGDVKDQGPEFDKTIVYQLWHNNPQEIVDILNAQFKKEQSMLPMSSTNNIGWVSSSTTPSGGWKKILFTGLAIGCLVYGLSLIGPKPTPEGVGNENKNLNDNNAGIFGQDPIVTAKNNNARIEIGDFLIGATEVTVDSFNKYCAANYLVMPKQPENSTGSCPVVNITADEAAAYCKWVGGRLPTATEWEQAALSNSPTDSRYAGGNSITDVAYYETNAAGKLHPVARKLCGLKGICDMSGNAAEWCSDTITKSGVTKKIVKGGHYGSPVGNGSPLQILHKQYEQATVKQSYIGFRVVWDIQ